MNRRQFLATSSLAASAGLFRVGMHPHAAFLLAQTAEPNAVVAQGRATGATAKITTKALRGNVSCLMGSGGNIAVLPGKDGHLLVDSGFSTSKPQITEALSALSATPVRHLVNTHWHYDHTDGNEWIHAGGATILAHENCKARLSSPQTIAAFHVTFPAAPAGAIPAETFADKKTDKLNGETLMLANYEPAHTDGDISIHFTDADVMHLGDTWFNGFYPFIDYSSLGSIDGMIRAAEHTLSTVSAKTILIPGHGPIGSKTELSEYRDVLVFAREHVAVLKKRGKPLEEAVAAKPLATYDGTWGAGFMKPEAFIGLVYQGV